MGVLEGRSQPQHLQQQGLVPHPPGPDLRVWVSGPSVVPAGQPS